MKVFSSHFVKCKVARRRAAEWSTDPWSSLACPCFLLTATWRHTSNSLHSIKVVKLCGRPHFSNPEFVFYCSKRLKVCISDNLHFLMSTMKDTCIAVCCAFLLYLSGVVFLLYLSGVVPDKCVRDANSVGGNNKHGSINSISQQANCFQTTSWNLLVAIFFYLKHPPLTLTEENVLCTLVEQIHFRNQIWIAFILKKSSILELRFH